MAERFTCRDQFGHARLMPGINLIDAVEQLCRIEERAHGRITVETSRERNPGLRCRTCVHYDPKSFGSGLCEIHEDRDNHGEYRGPNRVVAGARLACKDYEEAAEIAAEEAGRWKKTRE